MKPFILAIAALGLVGTIGTANADPLTATSIDIWNALTPSPNNTASSAAQQGLPDATTAFSGFLPEVSSPGGLQSYSAPIEYHTVNPNTTIGDFLASDGSALPSNCALLSTCAGTTISQGQGSSPSTGSFQQATVMEFTFTVPTAGTLLINHDDGVSVYVAGMEGSGDVTNDLYTLQYSAAVATDEAMPQTMANNLLDTLSLMPGTTYDLWYNEDNGLPATLDTTFTASVPAPPIGHGLPVVLAIAGILFGAKLWDRSKRRCPIETAASPVAA